MRWLRFVLMSAVVGSAVVGTKAQAEPMTLQDIQVFALGTINQPGLSLVDNQNGTFTITASGGVLTVTGQLAANNIGLTLGGELSFAGGVFSNLSPTEYNQDDQPNLITFETSAGEFSFSSSVGGVGSVGSNPFSDATAVLVLLGTLSGPLGYSNTDAAMYFFFDPATGNYGNASWLLLTDSSPAVPEPSTWLLAGLAATGLVWHRRRQRVA